MQIPAQTMIEVTNQDPLQENSELAFMRSKYPGLKQKSTQPFPYFYQLVPKDEQFYAQKLVQFSTKLKENAVVQEDMNIFQAIVLGKLEGMSLSQNPSVELGKLFSYQNRPYWDEQINDKYIKRNYGLQKQTTHMMYQIKDMQKLSKIFDVQQLKKQRRLIRQYSSFYKATHKFIQKFEKLKSNNQVSDLYQEYKKVQQQQSKLNKILVGQKTKAAKAPKIQVSQIQQKMQIAQIGENIELQEKINENKMEQQIEERKFQNNQLEVNKINPQQMQKKQEKEETNLKPEGKQSKKKAEPKQGTSNKKEKTIVDKNQILKSKYMSLDLFVKKKPAGNEENNKPVDMIEVENEKKQDKTDIFISMLSCSRQETLPSIQKLKQQFKSQKKMNQNTQTKICYVNIIMKRSRLEYYNFLIRQPKVDFTDPLQQKCDIRYDDSSDEYSELIADSINQQMVQQQQQEEDVSESNSAIVSDSFVQYKSSHVFSSEDDSSSQEEENKVKPQITKSIGKWLFCTKQTNKKQKYIKYDMEILVDDVLPIIIKDQTQQNSNELSASVKTEMYRQIHGSYTPKQVLIKKLNTIVENKQSLNKLSTLIKDICEKKGSQRVLKTQIIRQLAQQLVQINPNLESELEQLRSERQSIRNQEIQAKREQKINQRDQKLEKIILDYQSNQGNMTTNSILEHLRNNQVKIHKIELNLFIKTKQGQVWDLIRSQIKKNKLTKGKKEKAAKPSKTVQKEQLMNTHRPIDQILRQNQLQLANKPKKLKKVSDIEKQGEMMMEQYPFQQEYHQPSDDQSFELKKKQKRKGKSNKSKKKIVKITPLLPPIRRNPKRNKNKQKKQIPENENENEDHLVQEGEKNQEEQNQKNEQFEQEVKKKDLEGNEMMDENEQKLNEKVDQHIENNIEETNKQESMAKIEVQIEEPKNLPIAQVTPLRNIEMSPAKNEEMNNEKTANKIITNEEV